MCIFAKMPYQTKDKWTIKEEQPDAVLVTGPGGLSRMDLKYLNRGQIDLRNCALNASFNESNPCYSVFIPLSIKNPNGKIYYQGHIPVNPPIPCDKCKESDISVVGSMATCEFNSISELIDFAIPKMNHGDTVIKLIHEDMQNFNIDMIKHNIRTILSNNISRYPNISEFFDLFCQSLRHVPLDKRPSVKELVEVLSNIRNLEFVDGFIITKLAEVLQGELPMQGYMESNVRILADKVLMKPIGQAILIRLYNRCFGRDRNMLL